MKNDTDAAMTMVDASLVKPLEFSGKSIRLTGFEGKTDSVPLVKVW